MRSFLVKIMIRPQIEKLKKILLPYFPDSPWLKKHWWHKLIMLIAFIISAISLYSILFIVLSVFIGPNLWIFINSTKVGSALAYIIYIILSPLYLTALITYLLASFLPSTFYAANTQTTLIFITIALIFLPSLLYRLILGVIEELESKNK